MRKGSQVSLVYCSPRTLENLADNSKYPLTWAEMIQDTELGEEEMDVLWELSKKCDLSASDVKLLYQRYWLGMSGAEIGRKEGVSKMAISKRLAKIKKKLKPELVARITEK